MGAIGLRQPTGLTSVQFQQSGHVLEDVTFCFHSESFPSLFLVRSAPVALGSTVERVSCSNPDENLEDRMAVSSVRAKDTPEAQLLSLIEKFDPKDRRLIRSVRSAVRKRLPTANELVYDYGNSLVIGYSPTEGGAESIVATTARADGVSLYFNQGKNLPDPKKLLMGSAKQTRFIRVEAARELTHPDVEALIAAAIDQASVPLATKGRGTLVIKSTAAKKRLRRRPAK
jgi:hypothetical protein